MHCACCCFCYKVIINQIETLSYIVILLLNEHEVVWSVERLLLLSHAIRISRFGSLALGGLPLLVISPKITSYVLMLMYLPFTSLTLIYLANGLRRTFTQYSEYSPITTIISIIFISNRFSNGYIVSTLEEMLRKPKKNYSIPCWLSLHNHIFFSPVTSFAV